MKSVFAKPRFIEKAYPYRYNLTMVVDQIAGGIPTDPRVAEGWLRTKLADKDDLIREMVAEVMVERGVTAEEAAAIVDNQKHLNGFKRDKNGLYIEGRQLKACIKENGNVAINEGKLPDKWGADSRPTKKGWLGWCPEHIFVVEDRLYLGVTEPTGVVQQFVHTFRGNSIQYVEYVEEAKINATIITDHHFKDEEWAMLWLTAEQNGIGACRKGGFGRFTVVGWDKQ